MMSAEVEPRTISRVRLIRELNQMTGRLVRVHVAAVDQTTWLLSVTQGVLTGLPLAKERALLTREAIEAAGPGARVLTIDAEDRSVGLVAVPSQVDGAYQSDDGVAFQCGAVLITIQREVDDAI